MLVTWLLLLLGMCLLLTGGKLLVDGAVSIASRLGVSSLLVGLTIVSWGTSAPELALNSLSAMRGETGLVFGSLLGANIANLGLILGIAALMRPLPVSSAIIRREIPLLIGFTLAVTIACAIPWLPDQPLFSGGVTRAIGIGMVVAFLAYSIMLVRAGLREGAAAPVPTPAAAQPPQAPRSPLWRAALFIVVGIALLGLGGDLASSNAVEIALALGVSQTLVGLTIVAIGTTLPEAAAGLMAVARGHTDIAIGNAVGSCIFNISMILGLTSIIHASPIPAGGWSALILALALSIALVPLSRLRSRGLARAEGLILLTAYIGFLVYQVLRETIIE
jgi:cation:H+ antiporter